VATENVIQRAVRFFTRGIWDVVPSTLPAPRRVLLRALRFVLAVWRGFAHDRCDLHASALTYYTLMALVPVLVLALALGRVFGGAEIVRRQFEEKLSGFLSQLALQSASANQAASDASRAFAGQLEAKAIQFFDQINTISFGTLGGIGAVALIWMVITLLGRVELSFNLICGLPRPRSLWRKFTDYLSVVLILPFLMTAASTVPIIDLLARGADTVGGALAADTVSAESATGRVIAGPGVVSTELAWALRATPVTAARPRAPVTAQAAGFFMVMVCSLFA